MSSCILKCLRKEYVQDNINDIPFFGKALLNIKGFEQRLIDIG